ncbi:Pertactin autotransporter precursor [compost metagenome]
MDLNKVSINVEGNEDILIGILIDSLSPNTQAQIKLQDSNINVHRLDTGNTPTNWISGIELWGKGTTAVELSNSHIVARTEAAGDIATGVRLDGESTLLLNNNSSIAGGDIGIRASAESGMVAQDAISTVTIDNSVVKGESGSAIQAEQSANLTVNVQNGGRLEAGNGVIAEALNQGHLDLNVDNSQLQGDIQSDQAPTGNQATLVNSSSTNVNLQNNASWTGIATNVDAMRIDGISQWNMTGSSDVASLDTLGIVAFQPGTSYKTLTVGDLNGSGTFAMNTDLASEQGDLLKVLGNTSGSHSLLVADSGNEPDAANGQLMLVDGNGGDGSFALAGRPFVDAGAFRYSLEQQGNDWFLRNTALVPVDPVGPVGPVDPVDPVNPVKPDSDVPRLDPRPEALSDGANAALGNQSATATLWSAEMNALVKRLGELRMGEDNGGVWARGIGKTFEVDNGSSRSYDQNVHGLEIGADTAIALDGGKLYVGGMIGAATSDQDFGDGSSGTIDSKLIGAYATWLDDNGYYVDAVAKYNRLDNEVKTLSNTGEQTKGSYDTDGYGADVEVGKHTKLQDGWFIEPQAELTYTHTEGADYTASNGLKVEADDSDSLQGRVGALFGKSMELDNGMTAQPYVKASYVHEFNGDSSVTVNGYELDNQVSGSRSEIGFGSVLQVSEKTKVSLDVEHAKGNSVEEPWAVNIGVRFLW